jgi:hypothetical protein
MQQQRVTNASAPNQSAPKAKERTVLDMLVNAEVRPQTAKPTSPQDEHKVPEGSAETVEEYIAEVSGSIASGRLQLHGDVWVRPPSPFQKAIQINACRQMKGEQPIDAEAALALVQWPSLFVWAPEYSFPGLQICCPGCKAPITNSCWWRPKILHGVGANTMYISRKHTCNRCPSTQKITKKTFLGDSREAMANLPQHIASIWDLCDTGRTLCDSTVVDFVRSMATRMSWNAIAECMNELRATAWMSEVVMRYLRLCSFLKITPTKVGAHLPKMFQVTDDWVRNLYFKDAATRSEEIDREFQMERGDDILVLDWTKDVATRCGCHAVLNAMDGGRHVLLSRVTETCGPCEAQAAIVELAGRGIRPKVVYVDDECCGAWVAILRKAWPGVAIRLDGMHAISRLTRTVVCTQHPLHGEFCAKLSDAIYTYDEKEAARLRRARAREGLGHSLPNQVRNKFVPRVITDPLAILGKIESVIVDYAGRACANKEPLLTAETHKEWQHLRRHVENGCLCDPPDLKLHEIRGPGVEIGSELFFPVRTLRGASALEGFHTHQKAWLGPLAHHSRKSGEALLVEGAVRWNRKRHLAAGQDTALPLIFKGGLLQAVNALHRDLTDLPLFPGRGHISNEPASILGEPATLPGSPASTALPRVTQ